MSNYTIPNRPAAGATRHIADILGDFDTVTGYLDNIAASRRMLGQAVALLPNSLGTGTYFICEDGTLVASGSGSSKAVRAWYFQWTSLVVSSAVKILSLVLRASVAPNGTSSPAAVSCRLVPVTWSGSGGLLIPTAGTVVMQTDFTSPIGGGGPAVQEVSHAVPADGYYAPVMVTSGGSMPALACVSVTMQLFGVCT
jgi:hypothetical protein